MVVNGLVARPGEKVMNRRSIFSIMELLVLVACGNLPASMTQEPANSPALSQTPAPTAEPTLTFTVKSSFQSFSQSRCCDGSPVESGEYELPSWMDIPLTLKVGEDWRQINEGAARLFMLGKGRSEFQDPTHALVFITIPDGDPEQILTAIRNSRELIAEGEITPATIAGFSGMQVGVSAKPNPGYEGDRAAEVPPGVQFLPAINKYFTPSFLWTTSSAESRLRFIVLHVGEGLLLIEIDAPPADFEVFAKESNRVLETLKLAE
jgi:hypothetical protein